MPATQPGGSGQPGIWIADYDPVWDLIHRADDWAQQTGWEPGPSDA